MYIGKVKRKNLIVQSYLVIFLSTSSFVFLSQLQSEQYMLFFYLSVGLRMIQGLASAPIQICAYSFATNEMSHDKDTYIGYVEMALGVGDMIGPSIGGFVYDLTGFMGTFIVFGSMVLTGVIFSILMIPSSLNKQQS